MTDNERSEKFNSLYPEVFVIGKAIDQLTNIFVKELNLDDDSAAIVKYSLTIYSTSVLGYLAIFLAAWPLGTIKTAMVSVLTASALRIFSGGAHASCSRNCILSGAVIFPALGLMSKFLFPTEAIFLWVIVIVTIIYTSWAIYFFAPADTPGKPISTMKQRVQLRRWSFLFMIFWAAAALLILTGILNIATTTLFASALGLLWQGFSLTPSGYTFISMVDSLLEIGKGG